MSTKDLGLVTAYGYAKEGGFAGTEAEFKALLGNVANDLAEIESISASAETLDPGSSATASYNSGALEFGIPEGLPGRGITSIAKTAESGATKTYTITFTDNTTFTFDVTDGEVTEDSLEETLEDYAKTDGYYQDMSVGDAEQLVSTIFEEDSTPYHFRTSGGSIDIGDRETDMIVGGTIAWNQLVKSPSDGGEYGYQYSGAISYDGDTIINTASSASQIDIRTSSTSSKAIQFISGHKWFVGFKAKMSEANKIKLYVHFGLKNPSSAWDISANTWTQFGHVFVHNETEKTYIDIVTNSAVSGSGVTLSVKDIVLIDLTQMLGSTIADYIHSLETANAGAGVSYFRKLFPKPYYAYNAGELLSVSGLQSHDMRGFNAWDEEVVEGYWNGETGEFVSSPNWRASKNYIPCTPNTGYYFKATMPSSGSFGKLVYYDADKNFISSVGSGVVNAVRTTPANCHYMTFYANPNYFTNPICINLSWDGERDGEYEPYEKHSYALDDSLTLRGIPKLDANNHLYYDGDTYESDGTVTRKYGIVDLGTLGWYLSGSTFVGPRNAGEGFYPKLPSSGTVKAEIICAKYPTLEVDSMTDKSIGGLSGWNGILVKDSSYSTVADFKTAMSGVYLVYELATPTTESADPYTNPQRVDDFGTEEYVTTSIVPVGHVTQYQPNLRAKLEMLPSSPDSDGDYVVRHLSGENTFVLLEKELPSLPTEDGTYHLKCTVSGGTSTLTWESEE